MTGQHSPQVDNDLSAETLLRARRLGIETLHEAVVFMRVDCPVCRSGGFEAHARVKLSRGERSVIATLYHVTSDMLGIDEAGLSETAWRDLGLSEGDLVRASHPRPLVSLSRLRGKVYGVRFDSVALGDYRRYRRSQVFRRAPVGLRHRLFVARPGP